MNKQATTINLGALVLSALLAVPVFAAEPVRDYQLELPHAPKGPAAFVPPSEDSLPDNQFGAMVRYGKDLFDNTQQLRGKYVGNGMNCVNCHLDSGRKADSGPLWAAYTMYPAYRRKNDKVNTMQERIQGCFEFSMNGTPPPADSPEMTALVTYHYWLATGAPTGVSLPGRGYPKIEQPGKKPDYKRGEQVYKANCAVCHGADGLGTKLADGRYAFPPLWGDDSFNWGAGMHRINTAAAFIKANMPLGKPYSLSDQEAWDVALYMNSHDRPQDPRFEKDLKTTKAIFHDEQCLYGDKVNGRVLGGGHHGHRH